MINEHWKDLKNLILVAGHAVYTGDDFDKPEKDDNWFLQAFQKGEPPFYIEHIRQGVELAEKDRTALLVFSGGQTRLEAGPRSEAQSYWMIAHHFHWWWWTNVQLRATTEEFARDSFENVLFGICRFWECTGSYPTNLTVVSWGFKRRRFEMHLNAIGFPTGRFIFAGVNDPVDLIGALRGEKDNALDPYAKDPYGTGAVPHQILQQNGPPKVVDLGKKRDERNPFRRRHSYELSCPGLAGLLAHPGPMLFSPLPTY